ncbi:hypothetical protein [Rhodospira trueperi]|uniref:Chromosome partitioning protein, ParB family n=1 Tax=Rhodospira trueperi TaxID=69960 RepID=A0A1G6W317_9PROT|nr:hypothetical protein [Rhodospira trueperi]SDD60262.1 chromosome partitioning protein, ParB family [Rhodospira trueperi]
MNDKAADRLASLRKGEMATEAEALLAETGWLPEPLRTPGDPETVTAEGPNAESGEADEDNEAAEPDADSGAEATPEDSETDPVPEDIDDATRAAE